MQYTHRGRALSWTTPEGFGRDYCQNCQAGWTRSSSDGALTVCLLDREPIMQGMTSCDRFEAKELKPQQPEA